MRYKLMESFPTYATRPLLVNCPPMGGGEGVHSLDSDVQRDHVSVKGYAKWLKDHPRSKHADEL